MAHVLEAGCGFESHIAMPTSAVITGIDTSATQLARNTIVHKRIVGDIQSYPLEAKYYDMIVCWDVLEHLPSPIRALENLVNALAPRGILVLALPNIWSAKGCLTKLTPYWFHVWVRRTLFGERLAGVDDHDPFPTYLRGSIAPRALLQFARYHQFFVGHYSFYESEMLQIFRARNPVLGLMWRCTARMVQVLTLGRISADATDVLLVLHR